MTPTSDTSSSAPPSASNVRRYTAIALVAIAVIALAFVFWPEPPLYEPSTPAERAFQGTMASDLIGLARQERLFFRIHGHFTQTPDSTYYIPSVGVTKPAITLRDSGYYATITHARLPGVTCAIAVATRNPLSRNAADGDPVCR